MAYSRSPQTIPNDGPGGSTVRQGVKDQNSQAIDDLFVILNSHSNNEDGRTHAEIDDSISRIENDYLPSMNQIKEDTEGFKEESAQYASKAETSNQESLANKNDSAGHATNAQTQANISTSKSVIASQQASIATQQASIASQQVPLVTQQGDIQVSRVLERGNTEVSRVAQEGNNQVSNIINQSNSINQRLLSLENVTKKGAVLIVPSNYVSFGDEPDTVITDANLPNTVAKNSTYTLANPFGEQCDAKAQILFTAATGTKAGWGDAGNMWYDSGQSAGVSANEFCGNIVVQTGLTRLTQKGSHTGSPAAIDTITTPTPCRVWCFPQKLTGGNL